MNESNTPATLSVSPSKEFCQRLGIEIPVFCGAMYPCSNPELVAAASEAGGLGVIQPLSLSFVHGWPMDKGLKYLRSLTQKPLAFNALIEASSNKYMERMRAWVDLAIENDVKIFVTALGNPRWVVEKAHAVGGLVFHDVTSKKWAQKAIQAGVDGLICVNKRAGGHAGHLDSQSLLEDLQDFNLPLVCAGGVATAAKLKEKLEDGYVAVQMGTRFIVTKECTAHADYKNAVIKASRSDIVLTEKLTGVPVSVIATESVKKMGTKASFVTRTLLKNSRTKHWVRLYYSLQSLWKLKKASIKGLGYKDYWQAGKSAGDITSEESVADLMNAFRKINQ